MFKTLAISIISVVLLALSGSVVISNGSVHALECAIPVTSFTAGEIVEVETEEECTSAGGQLNTPELRVSCAIPGNSFVSGEIRDVATEAECSALGGQINTPSVRDEDGGTSEPGGGTDGTNGPRETFDATPGSLELPATTDNKAIEDNPIYVWLITIVNFLSIGVGIVATISVAIAGIQYTASKGDPNKTAAAVNRITQAGLAILLYVFGFALLNWLIPGGVI